MPMTPQSACAVKCSTAARPTRPSAPTMRTFFASTTLSRSGVSLFREDYSGRVAETVGTGLAPPWRRTLDAWRSEEHTSELQSLMRISYAVFCLKKKNKTYNKKPNTKRHKDIHTISRRQ